MALTTDKQRQALEAKGWRLTHVEESGWLVGEAWVDTSDAHRPVLRLWSDGSVGIDGYIDRHRLAEFLSIINAKDEEESE